MENSSFEVQRYHELDKELEILRVFSNKIKHLQLAWQDYQELSDKVAVLLKDRRTDESSDEEHVLEIERLIMEIISCILSVRDCLKNKVLAINEKDEVNGKICAGYKELASEYAQILNSTLDKNDENKSIRDLTTKLRNFLVHSSLYKTKLLLVKLSAKNDFGSIDKLYIACDFPHLCEKLDINNNYTLVWKYYLDKHLLCLRDAILSDHGQEFETMKDRMCKLSLDELRVQLEHGQANINYCPLILPVNVKQSELRRKAIDTYAPIYDRLLANQDYCLFAFKNEKAINELRYFDFGLALHNIYNLYFDYYRQLHQLIYRYYGDRLAEMDEIVTKIWSKKTQIELRQKYNYRISNKSIRNKP
ncbi:MAG: hypothetical protein Q7V63_02405 [Gammaproteobacteria bacterium]|nr:hypothetical protein [Gammaproteobacteria bacterium]